MVQGVAGQLIRCYRGSPEGASIAWLGPSRVDGANSRRADSSCSQGTRTILDLNFFFKFSALRTLAYVQVYIISCIGSPFLCFQVGATSIITEEEVESSWKLTVDSVLESLEESEPSPSNTRLAFDQWCASLYEARVRISQTCAQACAKFSVTYTA